MNCSLSFRCQSYGAAVCLMGWLEVEGAALHATITALLACPQAHGPAALDGSDANEVQRHVQDDVPCVRWT
jgi:hypothetical protein